MVVDVSGVEVKYVEVPSQCSHRLHQEDDDDDAVQTRNYGCGATRGETGESAGSMCDRCAAAAAAAVPPPSSDANAPLPHFVCSALGGQM